MTNICHVKPKSKLTMKCHSCKQCSTCYMLNECLSICLITLKSLRDSCSWNLLITSGQLKSKVDPSTLLVTWRKVSQATVQCENFSLPYARLMLLIQVMLNTDSTTSVLPTVSQSEDVISCQKWLGKHALLDRLVF